MFPASVRIFGRVGLAVLLLCGQGCAHTAPSAPRVATPDVSSVGRELDAKLFDSYNACDLATFGALIAEDVEFYHDKGGVIVGRQALVDAVRESICNQVRRELVPGSLTSFPMDNYGVLQFGEHRFCTAGTNTCTGTGRFVHLWRQTDGKWEATRIMSYDHQPL